MDKSTDIRTLKKLTKPTRYTIPDTRGLHLWVRADQKKYWIFRYTFHRKRFDISLGPFPIVPLDDARARVNEFRRKIFAGINPSTELQEKKSLINNNPSKTVKFREYAELFIEKMSPQWSSQKHIEAWSRSLETFAFPIIGTTPVCDINTRHVLAALEPIWKEKNVSASRIRGRIEKILSAAITTGLHKGPNPAIWGGHLENLLPYVKKPIKHFQALKYQEIPKLIRELHATPCMTSLALEFTILTAARSIETRGCRKNEVENTVWTIPASRMKARQEHLVPLTPRAIEIINSAQLISFHSDLVFSHKEKQLSHGSMLNYLKALGYGTTTVHGFRSAFRDWVSEETNFSSEIAEMSLAHTIKNKVEAAYRRGNLLQRRTELMNAWANYCLEPEVAALPPNHSNFNPLSHE